MQHVFLTHLKERRLKLTPQRRLILDVFLGLRRHVSAEELYALIQKKDPSIGQATVFRSMKLLVEAGVAQSSGLGGRSICYEPNRKHHDHLICTRCGAIREFRSESIEREQEKIAIAHGFALSAHRMELFGLCNVCPKGSRS